MFERASAAPGHGAGAGHGHTFRLGPGQAALGLAIVALALAVDALVRSHGDFDYRLIRSVRGTDFPGASGIADFLYDAGDPLVLLVAWFAGLAVFGLLRRWLELAAWASFAVGGVAACALAEAAAVPVPSRERWTVPFPPSSM